MVHDHPLQTSLNGHPTHCHPGLGAHKARELKTAGAYRIVRHPVYLAQLLCGAVVLVWRFCPVSAAVYLLFLAAQPVRIREEEASLAGTVDSAGNFSVGWNRVILSVNIPHGSVSIKIRR